MEKYSLVLKNDKVRQYHRMALFIVLLNVLAFLSISIYAGDRTIRIAALVSIILITITLLIQYFLVKTKQHKESPYLSAGLFIAFITWMQIGNVWATVLVVLLFLLYQVAKQQVAVQFYNDHISYTTFPRKMIAWNELNQVILKDGLLTVDFRNNKLIQSEITNSGWDVNEKEFNEFCRERMQAAISPA